MNRVTKATSVAFAGAAALALSIAAAAHAQQAKGPPPPPTEAEIAASPAAKRLKEALAAVNSGDNAAMLAYLDANAVEPRKQGPFGLPLAGRFLDTYRRSRGFDFVRMAVLEKDSAIAVVRNRITGQEEPFAVKIEPQAPHRITNFPNTPSGLAASLVRNAPAAQSEQGQLQQIGSYLKRLADADIFSGVVMIARDGKPVFSQAYGYADREKKILNTIDTPFQVASTTKMFTGLAIGRLVEQGKLSYEDPLSQFLPDFPDAESAKKIKIKHILSHTAGLGNFMKGPYWDSVNRLRDLKTYMQVADRGPLLFEPGTKWQYSNTGYLVLGRVIEVVTGQDYYDYMRKSFFARAGLKSDPFPLYLRNKVPGVKGVAMAQPYELEFDGQKLKNVNKLDYDFIRAAPSGGSLHSAPDLLKLSNALHAGRIVKPETLRLHTSPKPELGSPNYGYGFGTVARSGPRPFVSHGGNVLGVCTEYGDLRDTPYTLIILSNHTINTCGMVTGEILKLLPPTKAPAA